MCIQLSKATILRHIVSTLLWIVPGADIAMPYSLQVSMQTAMVIVTEAWQIFITDTSVFCGGQSGIPELRMSENAECKVLPIIGNDETILKS